MILRFAGFLATVAAVVILLGSLFVGLDGTAAPDTWQSVATANLPPVPEERIRVEVLNGAGIPGLARRVTEELRTAGFDVVFYGNAAPRDTTTILDRSGNLAAVQRLSSALRVDHVETAIDTTLYLEATVILGADWGQR